VDRDESCTTTIQESNQKSLQIRILRFHQLIGRPFEIDFSGAQDEKTGGSDARSFGGGIAANFFGLRIEMEIGEGEAVLEAMGGEQGGDAVDVAQAEDEADDGLRGDGVQAGGGGIVEHDGRAGNECAGDGDAAAHATGEFGGKEFGGVGEFNEAEDFLNAGLDFVFICTVFEKAVGDIFADSERVEESAFLEDEADLAASVEQFGLAQTGNFFVENANGAGIGAEEPRGELEEKSFAGAGFAEEDHGFALLGGKRDAAKNFAFIKAEADVIELDGGLADCGKGCRQAGVRAIHEWSEKLVREIESEFGKKGVRDDDEDGGDNDSLGGGTANALGPPSDIQALIASHRGNDEGKDDSFGETLHDVGEFENFDGAFPEGGGIDAQRENTGDHASEEADKHGDGGEKRKGDEGGEHAGSDELAAGVGAHGAHGVNLFRDLHGAEFGSNAGGAAAGDKEAGDGGAEFADEREGDDVAGEGGLAETLELGARLENHDRADEKTGEEDDGERADANVVHLLKGVLNVAGAGGEVGDGVIREFRVVLDFEDAGFGQVLKDLHDGGHIGDAHVLRCSLDWRVSHEFLWKASKEA